MDRNETKRIIQIMCATYPNYHPADLSSTVDIWCMMLEDYSYNEIAAALKAYITSDASGFAPSVGQVIEKLKFIKEPEQLNEMEAWAKVRKALRHDYNNAAEEYAKLPPLVQKAVGNPANLCDWAVQEEKMLQVTQSNFQRTYRSVVDRETQMQYLPGDVKALMQGNDTKLLEGATHGFQAEEL